MTLIEFDNCILDAWEKKDLLPNIQVRLSYIADEFAIGFAEWIPSTAYKESTCWRLYDKRDNEYTIDELLGIYKKEQEL
jgi:hypothetical protein